MYLTNDELKYLFDNINSHFKNISLLMYCYSNVAAKMSKKLYKLYEFKNKLY